MVGAVGWADIKTKSEEPKGLYYMYKKISMRNERMLTGLIFDYAVINLPMATIILDVLLLWQYERTVSTFAQGRYSFK